MRRAHRAVRPALLVAAVLLLSACGIPTTGVVGSGEPATGVRLTTTVYFIKTGVLTPVPRRVAQRAVTDAAVKAVFSGPDNSEQRAGMTSGLPTLTKDPMVRTAGAKVLIKLGFDTRPQFAAARRMLTGTGLTQLVCTAVLARQAEDPGIGSVSVIVTASLEGLDSFWGTEGNSVICSKTRRLPNDASQHG
jgi:hypothetical protein